MSAIPPNLAGPILQTPMVQSQLAAIHDNDEAHKATAERRQTTSITESDSIVETTDNDTEIYADAEGSGSQGRAFSEPEEEPPDDPDPNPPPEDGSHIDLEA
jgi:hypothetical protein